MPMTNYPADARRSCVVEERDGTVVVLGVITWTDHDCGPCGDSEELAEFFAAPHGVWRAEGDLSGYVKEATPAEAARAYVEEIEYQRDQALDLEAERERDER